MQNGPGFIMFDEGFRITFTNDNGQPISELEIASDGSPIFSIVGEPFYLIGKEKAREIIDLIIQAE